MYVAASMVTDTHTQTHATITVTLTHAPRLNNVRFLLATATHMMTFAENEKLFFYTDFGKECQIIRGAELFKRTTVMPWH